MTGNGLKTTFLVILPLSLAIGMFVSGIGTAMWPPVSAWAAPLACSGTVDVQSDHYTTPSGGSGVSRHILCVSGAGKEASADEITFAAIGIAGLLYAALIFVLLGVFVVPRLRRAAAERPPAFDPRPAMRASGAASPADLQAILGQVAEALRDGQADVHVRTINIDGSGTATGDAADPAARLAALKQLRDSGLIDDQDYQAKKAEILSGL
jgi:hypothetical protein